MRKIQFTGKKVTGHITAQYNADGLLQIIDFSESNCDFIQVDFLLRRMPVLFDSIEEFVKGVNLIAAEVTYEVTFDMWFDDYNYRVNKKKALELWNKMSKVKQVKCFYSNKPYQRFLTRKNIEKKYPDTYLRQEAYENDWDKVK